MTTPDIRSDSDPLTLLRALNDACGDYISASEQFVMTPAARNKLRDLKFIRRLVNAHLRQAEGKSGQRDSGGGPQQP